MAASPDADVFYDAEELEASPMPPPPPVLQVTTARRLSLSNIMHEQDEDLTVRKLIRGVVREEPENAPTDRAAADAAAPISRKSRKSCVSFAPVPHEAARAEKLQADNRRNRKTILTCCESMPSSSMEPVDFASPPCRADSGASRAAIGADDADADACFVLQPLCDDGRATVCIDASAVDESGKSGSLTIGRQHPSVPSNHGIHDSRVSRRHAQLTIGGASSPRLVVTAVGTNPIGVHLGQHLGQAQAAEERVSRQVLHKGTSAALRHGDRVQFVLDQWHPSVSKLDSSPGPEACAYRVALRSWEPTEAESPAPGPEAEPPAAPLDMASTLIGTRSPESLVAEASAPASQSPPVLTPEAEWLRRVLSALRAQQPASATTLPPEAPHHDPLTDPVAERRLLRSSVASAIERAASQLAEEARRAEAQAEALRATCEEKAALQQQQAELEGQLCETLQKFAAWRRQEQARIDARIEEETSRGQAREQELQTNREELEGTRAQLVALLDEQDEQKDEPKTCVVCYDEAPNMALVPCGHMCMCSACTLNLEQAAQVQLEARPRRANIMSREEARRWRLERLPKCPVCRQIFTETLRIYA